MAIQPVEQGSAFAFRNVINNNFYELKVLSGVSKPTQSTAAVVGQMYLDTSEGKMYFCSNVSGSVYTWKPFSEFSGNYNDLTNKPNSSKISYNNNLSSLEADNVQKAIDEIISLKAAKNGFATLDSSGKVPSVQLPSMNYIPNSQKGVANGVAPLDSNSKIDDNYIPFERNSAIINTNDAHIYLSWTKVRKILCVCIYLEYDGEAGGSLIFNIKNQIPYNVISNGYIPFQTLDHDYEYRTLTAGEAYFTAAPGTQSTAISSKIERITWARDGTKDYFYGYVTMMLA